MLSLCSGSASLGSWGWVTQEPPQGTLAPQSRAGPSVQDSRARSTREQQGAAAPSRVQSPAQGRKTRDQMEEEWLEAKPGSALDPQMIPRGKASQRGLRLGSGSQQGLAGPGFGHVLFLWIVEIKGDPEGTGRDFTGSHQQRGCWHSGNQLPANKQCAILGCKQCLGKIKN